MDSEAKFWLTLWLAIAVCFCVMVTGITVGAMQNNKLYYAAMNECIKAGGVWLPINAGGCSK